MISKKNIFFIGCGVMASNIVRSILSGKYAAPADILCNDIYPEKEKAFYDEFGIKRAELKDGIDRSGYVFICVKPQDISGLLGLISGNYSSSKTFISILAGMKIAVFERSLPGAGIIRVMPNILISEGEGVSALCRNAIVSDCEFKKIKKMFSFSGMSFETVEKKMNAVTAVSGSGPAYVFYFAEALIKAAVKNGLDKKTAREMVSRTIKGAGMMMSSCHLPVEELRKKVTSKGGTTAAAIEYFDKKGMKNIIENGVQRALKRARELSC